MLGNWIIMKKGFTLAEVLITLGIIGIIAALTIPSIIEGYKKKETEAKLKKVYSSLGQYIQKAETDNGSFCNWVMGSESTGYKKFEFYVLPYFDVIDSSLSLSKKNYSTEFFLDNVGYRRNILTNGGYTAFKTLNGKPYNDYWSDHYFLTKDGMLFGIGMHQSKDWYDCPWQVVVDINGPKKPNVAGKDLFVFEIIGSIRNTKINGKSNGTSCTNTECKWNYKTTNEDCIKYGHYCSNIIIQNGWKFPKDYP